MRLAFVHSGADLYGASRSLLRLATRLVHDGHGVCVVLPSHGPLAPELRLAGVEVRIETGLPLLTRDRLRSLRSWLSLPGDVAAASARLARLFGEVGADLVHTNTATVLLASALAARRLAIPHVWHIREFFTEFGPLWTVYRSLLCRYADRVIAVSRAVAGQFTAGQQHSKVRVVHNGFPADEFPRVSPQRVLALRARWGVGEAPMAGVIGRIKYRRKGQETFVEAAARLRPLNDAVRFAVVGTPFPGNERHGTRLAELVRHHAIHDRVVMPGDEPDIKAAYAALDIIVLPSGQPEPFGGVVIEAMASGRPVIGTAIGGTVEQIEQGVTGLLVPPNDPAALSVAMERLFSDPELASRMGDAGRRRFEACFEFEQYYARITALYRELLPSPPSAAIPSSPAPAR